MYRDFITFVLLGEQWLEASDFIGLWAFARSIYISFSGFYVEICISMGKPKPTVLLQLLSIFMWIPSLYISANIGYHTLYLVRCCVLILSAIPELIVVYKIADICFIKIFKNICPCFISAGIMFIAGTFLRMISSNMVWNFVSIFICVVVYFLCLLFFPSYRKLLKNTSIKKFFKKSK